MNNGCTITENYSTCTGQNCYCILHYFPLRLLMFLGGLDRSNIPPAVNLQPFLWMHLLNKPKNLKILEPHTGVLIHPFCMPNSIQSFPGKGGCVEGAGGGPCWEPSPEQPADGVCHWAPPQPRCALAGHHRHRYHGLLPAVWPQCRKYPLFLIIFHLSFLRKIKYISDRVG